MSLEYVDILHKEKQVWHTCSTRCENVSELGPCGDGAGIVKWINKVEWKTQQCAQHGPLLYDQGVITKQWGRVDLFKKWFGANCVFIWKTLKLVPYFTIYTKHDL